MYANNITILWFELTIPKCVEIELLLLNWGQSKSDLQWNSDVGALAAIIKEYTNVLYPGSSSIGSFILCCLQQN